MTVAPPPTDAERLTVTLPWPVRAAWPNGGHGHWAVVHRERKRQHALAYYKGLERPRGMFRGVERFRVTITGHPTRPGRVDADNLVAAVKGYLDGLALALRVDDSRFALSASIAEPVPGGEVVVTVEAAV